MGNNENNEDELENEVPEKDGTQELDPVVQELQQIRQTLSELQMQNEQLKQTNARLAQLASVGEQKKEDACSIINKMFS